MPPKGLRYVEVAEYSAALAVELDDRAWRARWLIQRRSRCPYDIPHELQREDPPQTGILADIFAVKIEFLNPAIFSVGDVDGSVLPNLNRMWQMKFAGTVAGSAPLPEPFAITGVFKSAGVA